LLTKNGWVHAGILGTILWGSLGWEGWLSVVFYLLMGSLVTKIGFAEKELRGISEGRGGMRGPENVWGSAATGTFFALLTQFDLWSKQLLLIGFAASFVAKLGDTFGSEIGKRWGRKTFLITSLRPVSAGTDGGISFEGTISSFFGSILMAFIMLKLSLIPGGMVFYIVTFSAFVATLLESFIGALYQKKFSFLTNEVVNFLQTFLAALIAIFLTLFMGILI
tara:strand:- start:7174 stop:7839 length:666 start_codon:yes stop_codon:yes gene_type:complete